VGLLGGVFHAVGIFVEFSSTWSSFVLLPQPKTTRRLSIKPIAVITLNKTSLAIYEPLSDEKIIDNEIGAELVRPNW